MCAVTVRSYKSEDMESVLGLYQENPLPVPAIVRDRPVLEHLLAHPHLKAALVAEQDGAVAGFALLAIRQRELMEGTVIELRWKDRATLAALAMALEEEAHRHGADLLTVCPPLLPGHKFLDGWSPAGTVLHVRPIDLRPVVTILCQRPAVQRFLARRAYLLKLGDDSFRLAGARAPHGAPSDGQPPIAISMTQQTFLRVVFGIEHPWQGWLVRRIHISPMASTYSSLKFLRAFRTPPPHFAVGDEL